MKVIVVHPDKLELKSIKEIIYALHPDYHIEEFTDPMLAFQYAFNNSPVDILYTLIEMKRLNGFTVARMIREEECYLHVIFFSYNKGFRSDAERFGCDIFIDLPLTVEKLQKAEGEDIW